jgi:hypothetical protein
MEIKWYFQSIILPLLPVSVLLKIQIFVFNSMVQIQNSNHNSKPFSLMKIFKPKNPPPTSLTNLKNMESLTLLIVKTIIKNIPTIHQFLSTNIWKSGYHNSKINTHSGGQCRLSIIVV